MCIFFFFPVFSWLLSPCIVSPCLHFVLFSRTPALLRLTYFKRSLSTSVGMRSIARAIGAGVPRRLLRCCAAPQHTQRRLLNRRIHMFVSSMSSSTASPADHDDHTARRSPWGSSTKHLTVVDAHCGGEPARVVVAGVPAIPGNSVLEQREYFMEHLDHYRTLLLTEPRGYPCQNANVIVPPTPACPDVSRDVLVCDFSVVALCGLLESCCYGCCCCGC